MRLTLICLFKKSVPGHIFRGKRRLVKEVKQGAMTQLIRDYERTERNMLYLRHPYLTLVSNINLHKTGHCEFILHANALTHRKNRLATQKISTNKNFV